MNKQDSRSGRRKLDARERALWDEIIRNVAPLARRGSANGRDDEANVDEPARKPMLPIGAQPAAPRRASSKPKPAPNLPSLERRLRQRLARGGEPMKRLDLHGLTQAEARAALLSFLRRAQARDLRFALVITGKGSRAQESVDGRGILRRQVPLWLQLPEFRPYVVASSAAHADHGGEGALYVQLRRRTR